MVDSRVEWLARIRARENAASARPRAFDTLARIDAHGHAAAVTVAFLFHPDCDRRPWNHTRSADPSRRDSRRRREGARGLSRQVATTAGGEFHPALRTLPALRAGDGILQRR